MIRKGISLQADYTSYDNWDGHYAHPNCYSKIWAGPPQLRNRDVVTGSNSRWVKLFVDWAALQEGHPASDIQSSWNYLNTRDEFVRIDRAIRLANDDGRGVILTVLCSFPTWTNGTSGPETEPGTGKVSQAKFPLDCGSNSPWGWFIGYLMARYHPSGVYNPSGPNPSNYFGNSTAARLNAVEFCNEPNKFAWVNSVSRDSSTGKWTVDPVAAQNNLVCRIGQMFQTAEYYSYGYASASVLGPAILDLRGNSATRMDHMDLQNRVMTGLANWRPRVYVGWSHHSYGDVADNALYGRTRAVINAVYSNQWKGPSADRYVWITETGYEMVEGTDANRTIPQSELNKQVTLMTADYQRVSSWVEIYLWTTHQIHDALGNSFNNGQYGYYTNGDVYGARRPYADTWQNFAGDTSV